MNDWEKEFWAVMDTVTSTVEDWVEGIEQTLTEISTTLEAEITSEWQGFWQDWSTLWDDVTDEFSGLDSDFSPPATTDAPRPGVSPWLSMDWEMGLNPYFPATVDHQPACQGCQHYHGYVYGGKLLVCGMHPYGSETGDCPDWEGPGNH